MSLRPSFRVACQALASRSGPALPRRDAIAWAQLTKRGYSPDDAIDELENALANMKPPSPRKADPSGKDSVQQDALAEEAAADRSDLTAEDAFAQLQKAAQGQSGLEGGLTPEQEEHLYNEGSIPPVTPEGSAQRDLELIASGGVSAEAEQPQMVDSMGRTHKWPLPATPLGPQSKLKARYHPVLDQLTNLLMRHGKKSMAQRNMAMILNFLRTSPPPILNPKNPLMAGHPPPSHLPLNPVLYLTLVIDSVAPLVRVAYLKGQAGGGRALEMPMPLPVRPRRRIAFQSILESVNKKRSAGSGRTQLAHRIASEIIAVAEGRSTVWDKRLTQHKLATVTRANINAPLKKKGSRK